MCSSIELQKKVYLFCVKLQPYTHVYVENSHIYKLNTFADIRVSIDLLTKANGTYIWILATLKWKKKCEKPKTNTEQKHVDL